MSHVTCHVSHVTCHIPPPKKNFSPMIRIGREIQCLPYAGFFPFHVLLSLCVPLLSLLPMSRPMPMLIYLYLYFLPIPSHPPSLHFYPFPAPPNFFLLLPPTLPPASPCPPMAVYEDSPLQAELCQAGRAECEEDLLGPHHGAVSHLGEAGREEREFTKVRKFRKVRKVITAGREGM